MKGFGLQLAHLITDDRGGPVARTLRILPQNGGEIRLHLNPCEILRLQQVLTDGLATMERTQRGWKDK